MKRLLSLIAVAALLMGNSSFAQDEAAHRALAEELLNSMNMQDTLNKSFAVMKSYMAKVQKSTAQTLGSTNTAVSEQTDAMMEKMAKELSWDKIKEDYISVYADTFTDEELKGLIAFYSSPVGQAFLVKQPQVMSRTMELSQKAAMKVIADDPMFGKVKAKTEISRCINNMRIIDSSKELAAIAHKFKEGDTATESEVSEYVRGGKLTGLADLVCPDGGHYILHAIGEEPECSKHGTLSAAREKAEAPNTAEAPTAATDSK